ncbi:MAG: MFS transporter [Candidatus Stahlbacteria bacterium]|nr:MFS transporter [Candidatus Stahlbacteria bacterium]
MDNETKLKETSLKLSIKEGASCSAMIGLAESYIAPYAIAVGALPFQIAILTSIPNLFGSLAQLVSIKFMQSHSRKGITTRFVFANALMWLPMIGSLYAYYRQVITFIPLLIISIWTFYLLLINVAAPAWQSWMGDLVPEASRGKYFGIRNTICNSVLLVSTLLGGMLLDHFKKLNLILVGFGVLFFVGMLFRLLSAFILTKQYEPHIRFDSSYYFSFPEFIRRMRGNNFGRFVIFVMLTTLSCCIAVPFFAPYMLRDLKFNYTLFILIAIVTPTISSIITAPLWGRFSDKFGNIATLRICSLVICFIPLSWLLSRNPYYLIFVPQTIGGAAWAGFGLATSNFIYDAVTRQRRGLCFAYYNVLNGIGIFIGATIGSFIVKLPIHFMNIFLFIFLISSILRLIVFTVMLPKIKEVKFS